MYFRDWPGSRQQYGLVTFQEYREAERGNRGVVGPGAVEWETLELRVHPPNVAIDNENYNRTVVTIDSANRPGTLIEVVQCLTELGLNIGQARVSSDGGWFVDEFHITEQDGSVVTNQNKLNAISKVLSIDFDAEQCSDASNQVATVFELAGADRLGLLADVLQLLTANGCVVCNAAVWTYNNRVAFVVGVVEDDQPIKDNAKLNRLKTMLLDLMDTKGNAIVTALPVGILIHHDRRLHRLMLLEEQRLWKQNLSSASTSSGSNSSAGLTHDGEDLDRPHQAVVSQLHSQVDQLSLSDNGDRGHMALNGAGAASTQTPFAAGMANGLPPPPRPSARSAKHSRPQIVITEDRRREYWMVDIQCKDRAKLFFDTVCTLADLDYNIYHATIDTDNGHASQLYYIRPRFGDYEWDVAKVAMLKNMLDASIQRRHPKGLKVHVHTFSPHSLAHLTMAFKQANLYVTRAKVRSHLSDEGGHTFYLMDASTDDAPHPTKVKELLTTSLLGKLIESGDKMAPHRLAELSSAGFPFCYTIRSNSSGHWTGQNSTASSTASV